MSGQFTFETADVETPTTRLVREALDAGRGALVVGGAGSGKSHAVRAAVNGAIWSVVSDRPYAVPRMIADLSAQAGGGDAALRAYDESGCAAGCAALDALLGDRVVVIDAAERLFVAPPDPVDPDASSLWADEIGTFRDWVRARCADRRTVVVTRWAPSDSADAIAHQKLPSWPIKLVQGPGFLPWKAVADVLRDQPGALRLAASALRFAGIERMRSWLNDSAEESSLGEASRGLATLILRHAPPNLVQTLAVLQAAGEVRRDLVDRLKGDFGDGVDLGERLGLIETHREHGGVLRVLPFLEQVAALPGLSDVGGDTLVARAAGELLAGINDRSSLNPSDARDVLDAHRLQLAVGDFEGALSTARLHLGGLVLHARAKSLAKSFDAARRAYGDIARLFDDHPTLGASRVRGYVAHYHGYNGYRARTLGLDRVAGDYDGAVSHWGDNALFHARRIALAAERGDPRCSTLVEEAYDRVPDHPRRDAFLRVRVAHWAHEAGAHEYALQHLESYQPPSWLSDLDPEAYDWLLRLERSWRDDGLELERLSAPDGRQLVFTAPLRARATRGTDGWHADSEYPPAQAVGPGPWSAMRALGAVIADECLRLVSQPTARLARHEVGLKGLYLGAVDLGLSEIGLPLHPHRWLIGAVDETHFLPSHTDLERLPLPPELAPMSRGGMFFARVPVGRAGLPNSRIDRLVSAGAGRTMTELLAELKRVIDADENAA